MRASTIWTWALCLLMCLAWAGCGDAGPANGAEFFIDDASDMDCDSDEGVDEDMDGDGDTDEGIDECDTDTDTDTDTDEDDGDDDGADDGDCDDMSQPGSPRSVPACGDCLTLHGTPGCETAACETAVCAADAFCCEVEWDQVCIDVAVTTCVDAGICTPS